MSKKKKEPKNKYLAVGIVVLALVIGVSFVANAGQSLKSLIADKVSDRISPDILKSLGLDEEDERLGAVVGPDIFNRWYFYEGIIADTPIDIDLMQTASSTAADPPTAGFWCNNTNRQLLVDGNWYLDIQTANGLWGSNWTVGTTTKSGDSFTATTTATILASTATATSTTGIYDRDTRTQLGTWYDDGGNATTTPFLLDRDVCMVVFSDHSGATSSDSYLSSGGFTSFIGGFHANASIR